MYEYIPFNIFRLLHEFIFIDICDSCTIIFFQNKHIPHKRRVRRFSILIIKSDILEFRMLHQNFLFFVKFLTLPAIFDTALHPIHTNSLGGYSMFPSSIYLSSVQFLEAFVTNFVSEMSNESF